MGWHFPRRRFSTSNDEHTTSQPSTEEASGMTGRQMFFSGVVPSCLVPRAVSRGRKASHHKM